MRTKIELTDEIENIKRRLDNYGAEKISTDLLQAFSNILENDAVSQDLDDTVSSMSLHATEKNMLCLILISFFLKKKNNIISQALMQLVSVIEQEYRDENLEPYQKQNIAQKTVEVLTGKLTLEDYQSYAMSYKVHTSKTLITIGSLMTVISLTVAILASMSVFGAGWSWPAALGLGISLLTLVCGGLMLYHGIYQARSSLSASMFKVTENSQLELVVQQIQSPDLIAPL